MKLWYSPASPFVRKVRVLSHELGLSDAIETVRVNTTVIDSDPELRRRNPLGKIPALEFDDGRVLFDSSVICAYLMERAGQADMSQDGMARRFDMLTLEALCDGIMEAAVAARYESALRPEASQWQAWKDAQMAKVESGLDSLERQWLGHIREGVSPGAVAAACAMGYLDFRFSGTGWRDNRPGLAEWFESFRKRESMRLTEPT